MKRSILLAITLSIAAVSAAEARGGAGGAGDNGSDRPHRFSMFKKSGKQPARAMIEILNLNFGNIKLPPPPAPPPPPPSHDDDCMSCD